MIKVLCYKPEGRRFSDVNYYMKVRKLQDAALKIVIIIITIII
jgi:hypothetical protein